MTSNRFDDAGGKELDLNRLAFPFYNEMQSLVGELVRKNTDSHRFPHVVFDLGIGTGDTTIAVAEEDPHSYIFGIDEQEHMIAEAKDRLHYLTEQRRLNLVTAKAQDRLAYQAAWSVDAIVSASMLHNNPRETRADIFEQSHRVLGSGGIFITADKIGSDDREKYIEEVVGLLKAYDVLFGMHEEETRDYWLKHNIRDNELDLRMTVKDTMQELEKAGFKNPEVVRDWGIYKMMVAYA